MSDLQEEILAYQQERKWDNLAPADLAKSISIEAAELLEHFQWSNPTVAELKDNPEKFAKLTAEIADVLIYSLELCAALGVDYQEVAREKLEKVKKKYPVEEVLGRSDNYLKIKQKHRQEGTN